MAPPRVKMALPFMTPFPLLILSCLRVIQHPMDQFLLVEPPNTRPTTSSRDVLVSGRGKYPRAPGWNRCWLFLSSLHQSPFLLRYFFHASPPVPRLYLLLACQRSKRELPPLPFALFYLFPRAPLRFSTVRSLPRDERLAPLFAHLLCAPWRFSPCLTVLSLLSRTGVWPVEIFILVPHNPLRLL